MRRLPRLTILLALSLSWNAGGCSKQPPAPPPSGAARTIVCTLLPLYVWTTNVVGDTSGVRVVLLLEPRFGCPHDYSLTTRDRKLLAEADLVLANGLGLETFLERMERTGKTRIVETAKTNGLLPDKVEAETAGHDEHEGADSDHHHGAFNPHVWTSPVQAIQAVQLIARELGALDPPNQARYQANADAYVAKLQALAEELRAAAKKFKSRNIATQHNVFDYLARDLDLKVIVTLQEHEGQEPSAKQLNEVMQAVKTGGAAAIFAETGSADRLPAVVSRETGVPLFTLDPLTRTDLAAPPRDFYETRMRENLKTLQQALGGH